MVRVGLNRIRWAILIALIICVGDARAQAPGELWLSIDGTNSVPANGLYVVNAYAAWSNTVRNPAAQVTLVIDPTVFVTTPAQAHQSVINSSFWDLTPDSGSIQTFMLSGASYSAFRVAVGADTTNAAATQQIASFVLQTISGHSLAQPSPVYLSTPYLGVETADVGSIFGYGYSVTGGYGLWRGYTGAQPTTFHIEGDPLFATKPAKVLLGNTSSISGILVFDGLVIRAPSQNVTFTYRPNDGSSVNLQKISVPSNGTFLLNDLPRKAGVLHIKGDKFLAVNLPLDLSAGSVSGVTAELTPGDATNDNRIDIGDFGVLVGVYGDKYTVTDPNADPYDVASDFNGDGKIDIVDFSILVSNFGFVGDP